MRTRFFEAEKHFKSPAVRYEKGSGMEIIVAEFNRRVDKTNRLKAARETQEAVQGRG